MMASIPPVPASDLIGPVLIPESAVPLNGGTTALMSKSTRDGEWLLPRLFRALCVMGELDLDLTRVRLGPGVSDLEIVVFMGQVTVRVPQNLRVECHGEPVLGELKVRWGQAGAALPDAPLLRIRASGAMATIVINLVDPNAARWREARKRAKRER